MINKDSTRQEEYNKLVEEHQQTNTFQRSLLLLGIIVTINQYLSSNLLSKASEIEDLNVSQIFLPFAIPVILIGMLYSNLLFISNRIHSDARIVAYIQLFHEGYLRNKWIGWETSLRYNRKWVRYNPPKEEKVKKKIRNYGRHDYFSYVDIFYGHFIIMSFIYLVWITKIVPILAKLDSDLILFSLTVDLIIIFTVGFFLVILSSIKKYKYIALKDTIEQQRVIWILTYKQYSKDWDKQIKFF